jgi:hypothetical protein
VQRGPFPVLSIGEVGCGWLGNFGPFRYQLLLAVAIFLWLTTLS